MISPLTVARFELRQCLAPRLHLERQMLRRTRRAHGQDLRVFANGWLQEAAIEIAAIADRHGVSIGDLVAVLDDEKNPTPERIHPHG